MSILEEELDWARKIISLEQFGMIRVNSTGNHESTSNDLYPVQKSNDSIIRMERSMKANSGEIVAKSPNVCLQFRPSSDERNEDATTGESSPGQGVHHTKISPLLTDKEHTPNHMLEPLQHDQETLSIKEATDVNVPRQMQGDENAATNHTQEAQHTNTKAITRAP
ncbi:hypothetical protein H5410_003034 [Solanum commersonii]|uniref:Uncharacterized protein n=1 Tax=Solanum commersonii TaxID=4109 RepID=A0A9J6B3J1_SOLCO|nr:hypothetical protein H5410_003034 [Solanum commersonii]